MKKQKAKLIILIFSLIIGVVIIFINNKQDTDLNNTKRVSESKPKQVDILSDGTKLNKSKKLQEKKKFEGLTFTNMQLTEKGGITTLLADVENTTNKDIIGKRMKIEIIDEKGNIITTAIAEVNVKSNKKTQLNASVSSDVVTAYDFKISNI